MIRKLSVVFMVALLGMLALPAQAGFKQGDFDLTLSGQGANSPDFDGFAASATVNLGYFLTDQIEVGVRQSLGYSDVASADGGDITGSTRVALDYNFNLGAWVPYVGVNVGYVYGDGVNDTFEAAPEAGVKYFVNSTTYIFVSAEYQFFFNNGDDASDSFSDGQFLYGLGIGFRF